jgi:hypothetical protein
MKIINFVFQQYLTAFIDSGFMMHTAVHKFLASGTLTFFIISLADTDLLEARSLCSSATFFLVSLTDTDLDFDSHQGTVTYIYVTHEILATYRQLPDDRRETGSLSDCCI